MTKRNNRQQIGEPDLKSVGLDVVYDRFSSQGWVKSTVQVPNEMALTISVNRQEWVTILCTPTKLNCLVLGFLYGEEIISGVGDIKSMRMCEEDALADVMLSDAEYELPTLRTITSGCGGGAIFKTRGQRVDSDLVVTPMEVLSLVKLLQEHMVSNRLCGGVHASALSDSQKLLVVAEDIGRHNTLDKIQGECLLSEVSAKDRLILTTGRISSEMLLKAARMEAPIVVSRHSPTENAVSLARDLGITLVGYARGRNLSVYSHSKRLQAHQA